MVRVVDDAGGMYIHTYDLWVHCRVTAAGRQQQYQHSTSTARVVRKRGGKQNRARETFIWLFCKR